MNASEALRAVVEATKIAIDPDLANFGLGGLGFDSDDVHALLKGATRCAPNGSQWILACQYEGSYYAVLVALRDERVLVLGIKEA